ncbi:MAG: AAA family ATPase [Clostridia bacterium]|nr:AAA family ATPase [Clostridia bacterium]
MLLGIRVRNFEMLRDTRVGIIGDEVLLPLADTDAELAAGLLPPLPLAPLSALIGRNDTGKSSLFHAMSFLSDVVRHGARFAATQHGRKGFTRLRSNGGPDPVVFDLAVRLDVPGETVLYHVAIDCDRFGRPFILEEEIERADFESRGRLPLLRLDRGRGVLSEGQAPADAGVGNEDATGLGTYGALVTYPCIHALYAMVTRWFFCSFLPHEAGQETGTRVSSGGHRHLSPDGGNVENVLEYFKDNDPEAYEHVIGRIREKMPGSRRIDDAVLGGRVSAASRRLFTYLLLLEDPSPRPVLCIENPDEGLHHEMVDTLAAELRAYSLRRPDTQILFTTHNPYLLESMSPDEVWVFERKPAAPDAPHADNAEARCAGADPVVRALYAEGVGMGSMWYSGHFDPENGDAS